CAGQGLGFEIEEEKVFVFPETRTIAVYFAIDPLCLISSGTLLVVTPLSSEVLSALQKASIPAFEIGRVTENPRKVVRRRNRTVEEVKNCPQDELWRIVERL
ncbi:MAG: AIR synthase-related protein, partial [Candidatus Caldatribacteriaceae bacterium]